MDKRGSKQSTPEMAITWAPASGAVRGCAWLVAGRLLLPLVLVAALFPHPADASDQGRTAGVLVHPVPALLGAKPSVDVQYRNVVLHVGVFTSTGIFSDVQWTGWEGSVAYRFYVARPKGADPIEGLYLAPVVAGGSGKDISGTGRSVMVGFDAGYELVFWKGLTVDVNTGWRQRVIERGTANDTSFPFLFSPHGAAAWWPGVGIGIGFSF